jgi:hypothetical protein
VITISKTNFAENKTLDHMTGKATWSAVTARVALFTAMSDGEAGAGTEVTGGSYARVTTGASDWNTASAGSTSNAAAITFPTASASWGTVTHFALMDAATGGNMLRWAALGTSKAVGNGDTATFPAGSLVFTED